LIRLLTRQDHDRVLAYLNHDPLHNIYLIHGLRPRGLESNSIALWGAFSDKRLEGVLCIDYESRPCAGYLASDSPQVSTRLGRLAHQSGAGTLIGNKTHIQPATTDLGTRIRVKVKHLNFYRADPESLVRYYDYPVRVATKQDIPSLVALYREYEFARKDRTDEEIEHAIAGAMDHWGVYFIFESKGRAISAARVFPQTDQAGVIGAARTLPEFRGRGIYLSVRTVCFEYLFSQGKTGLGMFVDTNASMYRVLNKQGGTIVAEWLIAHLRAKPPLRQRILPQRVRRWGLLVRDHILSRQRSTRRGRCTSCGVPDSP